MYFSSHSFSFVPFFAENGNCLLYLPELGCDAALCCRFLNLGSSVKVLCGHFISGIKRQDVQGRTSVLKFWPTDALPVDVRITVFA